MAQCGGRRKAPGRPFPPPRTSVWNNSYETLVGGASNGDDNDELPLTPPDAVYAPTRSGCQAPKKPGASALYYERVLDVVIEHVFGWDTSVRHQRSRVVYSGIPVCWSMCTEEHERKTLHGHGLLACLGHRDLLQRLGKTGCLCPRPDDPPLCQCAPVLCKCDHLEPDREPCAHEATWTQLRVKFEAMIHRIMRCELPLDDDMLLAAGASHTCPFSQPPRSLIAPPPPRRVASLVCADAVCQVSQISS